jgi:hypothetical protein
VIVPVPSRDEVLVLVVALTPVVPEEVLTLVLVLGTVVVAGTVVVVVDVCARAVLNATAVTAPTANNLLSGVCFMFVLCFVQRMMSVVLLIDCSSSVFIQPTTPLRELNLLRLHGPMRFWN